MLSCFIRQGDYEVARATLQIYRCIPYYDNNENAIQISVLDLLLLFAIKQLPAAR